METKIENQDSQIPDLDLNTASQEEIKAHALKLKEMNAQLYARTKKAETTKKESDEALRKAVQEKMGTTEPKTEFNNEDRFARIELMAKGYSDDELDFIMANGGKKALENPFVKSAVEGIRTQRKAEQAATIDSSSKSDISKRYTDAQIAKMSAKQLQELLES
jgi:hypothetical protein